MAAWELLLFCLYAIFFAKAYTQSLPCNGNNLNVNIPPLPKPSGPCNGPFNSIGPNIGQLLAAETPMKITSATFTPINNVLASQAGLPPATVSEVVPNLQFGDVTISGDLPIGGTIKVSGCFPVYGMVGVDGVVPTSGSAMANAACNFPAQLQQNSKPPTIKKPCVKTD